MDIKLFQRNQILDARGEIDGAVFIVPPPNMNNPTTALDRSEIETRPPVGTITNQAKSELQGTCSLEYSSKHSCGTASNGRSGGLSKSGIVSNGDGSPRRHPPIQDIGPQNGCGDRNIEPFPANEQKHDWGHWLRRAMHAEYEDFRKQFIWQSIYKMRCSLA
jgi:hypothetical protein